MQKWTISAVLAACLAAAGCAPDVAAPAPAEEAGVAEDATGWLPPAPAAGDCPDGGRLTASLYGALEGEIDWHARDMSCEGMPRPSGAGARLRFAGEAGEDGVPIAVIIAIPQLQRGATGRDLPSNVTIIEEGKGRFFSSADRDYCWVDVDTATPLDDGGARTAVAGRLSCIAPLAQANGATSVTIGDLRFHGYVDWSGG